MSTPSTPTAAPTAIVVASEEETRVLLRGLLRLHHHRVLGEADGVTGALDLIEREHPDVAVVDSMLAEGSVGDLVPESKRRRPSTRVIVLVHGSRPGDAERGPAADVVLKRPFRILEFAHALGVGVPPLAALPT